MTAEQLAEYVAGRYEDQVAWYADRASHYKKLYGWFQWGVIILATTQPVVILATRDYKWAAVSVAAVLAIGTAGLKAFKFQENWINYRTVSETLKKEKYFHMARVGDYANIPDPDRLFVERVESLISRENSLWVTTHKVDVSGGEPPAPRAAAHGVGQRQR